MKHVDEAIVSELLARFDHGMTVVQMATWLWEQLGESPHFFKFLEYFFITFDVSVGKLRDMEEWRGLGYGGSMSDEELERLLSPLVPRSRPPRPSN